MAIQKVRVFPDTDACGLERKINDFICSQRIVLIDIKFSVSTTTDGHGYNRDVYTALVLYQLSDEAAALIRAMRPARNK